MTQSAFASLVLQKLDGQDQLTKVGHSVDSKHSAGLSFQCAIALTPLADMLAIVGEFLSRSLDIGFVLALPIHHRGLELDSVRVLTKIMLLLW